MTDVARSPRRPWRPTEERHSAAKALRVHFDRGIHQRPGITMCRVIRRHGRDGAGVDHATVEHEGHELRVESSMVANVWRPVRGRS
jgi:hypothetical protein